LHLAKRYRLTLVFGGPGTSMPLVMNTQRIVVKVASKLASA
jgi:hypothetical protein